MGKIKRVYQGGVLYDLEDPEIRALVGSLTDLDTEDKSSIVAAVNETVKNLGVKSYSDLSNKPTINGVVLSGNKTNKDLGLADPSDAQVATAVSTWLDSHPEATTTVEDGSITYEKLHPDTISQLSEENPSQGGGLTTEQINALYGMLRVAAYDPDSDYAGAHAAFCTAFGLDVPDGGDTPGGDTGGDDTGGSGGDNTGGSGGEDSGGGEETGGSTESTWTDGVAYEWENVAGEYVDATDGSFVTYSGWSRTPYMACSGATVLRAEVIEQSASMSRSNSAYNVFYDTDRQFISSFHTVAADAPAVGTYTDIEIPANAAYFIVSHKGNVMGETGSGIPYIRFIPYREVPV